MKRLLILAVFALPAFAADLTGTWQFQGDVSDNPVQMECALRQEGAKLSGTCRSPDAGEWTISGEVKDTKVSFVYSLDYQGTTYTLQYTGKIDDAGTGLNGNIEVSGASGTFSAKKV